MFEASPAIAPCPRRTLITVRLTRCSRHSISTSHAILERPDPLEAVALVDHHGSNLVDALRLPSPVRHHGGITRIGSSGAGPQVKACVME